MVYMRAKLQSKNILLVRFFHAQTRDTYVQNVSHNSNPGAQRGECEVCGEQIDT